MMRNALTRLMVLTIPALLTACTGGGFAPIVSGGVPAFDPLVFFAGHTEGDGHLHVILSHVRDVRVHGTGEIAADGSLRLVQMVEQQGKPPERRQWLIRQAGPGRYAGTLTDARGPIGADVERGRLRIRFHTTNGYSAEQWLVLAPDGQSARNHMTFRKLGLVVATLDERIARKSRP